MMRADEHHYRCDACGVLMGADHCWLRKVPKGEEDPFGEVPDYSHEWCRACAEALPKCVADAAGEYKEFN